MQDSIDFALPENKKNIIKVIGVGGGGGNAVDNMYKSGINDVDFVICNTDAQVLRESSIPTKIYLGDGLGVGGDPEKGKTAALEGLEKIEKILQQDTKMVFITAGMGGGTGTGAAPIIARKAKDMGILTVGIVTIPFFFEGEERIYAALQGVKEIKKNVDALLVINNDRILSEYDDQDLKVAFEKADETLTVAAKSIAEIITLRGIINVDFNDVKAVLENGGGAIMSSGLGKGENRISTAIANALHSPLLNNSEIFSSERILINIVCPDAEGYRIKANELLRVKEFMKKFKYKYRGKFGVACDPDLKEEVKVTILATDFDKSSEDDETEIRISEHEDKARRELIAAFYEGSNPTKVIQTHVFNDEDLDNDDMIEEISNSPTYRRTSSQLAGIIERTTSGNDEAEETVAPEEEITTEEEAITIG